MKNISKRFLSLFMSLVIVLSGVLPALAEENGGEITPTLEVAGEKTFFSTGEFKSSTDFKVGNFSIGQSKARLKVEFWASEPLTMYFIVCDSHDNTLATSTCNMTKSDGGSYTTYIAPNPIERGSYIYKYFFNKSGVSCSVKFFCEWD